MKRDAGVREEMVWRRPQNSSNVVIASSGHLIAQEAPVELGMSSWFVRCSCLTSNAKRMKSTISCGRSTAYPPRVYNQALLILSRGGTRIYVRVPNGKVQPYYAL